ncbi:MAG: winged helix-turn-helix domain-containing protein [Acidobacteriota bacterium]|nr:winged helix-turn-helix domain-containing protein [Acidobacteriota bacterium]
MIYKFSEFKLDDGNLLLWRDSEVFPLAPKTCEVLLALIENAGQVLSRQELLEKVWGETFIEEANLTLHISALRKALGEEKNGKKFIETIPRRGYRFVVPVIREPKDALEITVTERTRTHLIEKIEIAPEAENPPIQKYVESKRQFSFRHTKIILPFAACVALLAIGMGIFGDFSNGRKQKAAFTAPRLAPVTIYTGQELDPAISPDGRLVAYCGTNTLTGNQNPNVPEVQPYFNIFVKQTDGESVLQLTNKPGRAMNPVWSPDGRFIAYAQKPAIGNVEKNILFIIPSLGGAEQKIYEAPDLFGVAWSPDGKTLAFAARKEKKPPHNLYTISLETREVRQITFSTEDADFNNPTFSPDGKMISFIRVKSKSAEVFTVPAIGGEERQITFDNHNIIGHAAWTPDGKNLIYGSNRTGTYRLWQIPATGGEQRLLSGAGEPALDPSISADGKRLVYVRMEIDFNVWRVPLENGKGVPERAEKIVSSFRQDRCPAISPDVSRISFVSNQSGGARQVWTANADGKNQRQLTSFPDGSTATRTMWSPDGKHLAFDATEASGNSAIYILNVESGIPQKITDGERDALAPSWSADGRFVYFTQKLGDEWQVWKISAVGGVPVQVTKNGGYEARESADGKFLYYNKGGYGAWGIFRQPNDGCAEEEKILDLHQVESVGEWTLTNKGIYFLHRSEVFEVPSKHPRIRFLDFATEQISDISPLPRSPFGHIGLSISPDSKWLYYSLDDKTDIDLMLAENFE